MQKKIIEASDINSLYSFNKEVFPERLNTKQIINFWFNKNEEEHALSIILKGNTGEIWGQVLSSSMIYFNKNCGDKGIWILNYIIREDKRKDGYGIDIMQFVLENKETPVFATGSGPLALKIELKMGFKLLGELKKYVGIVNPIYCVTSIFRNAISLNQFPSAVTVKGVTFSLTDKEILPDITKSFNENLLEFGRDKSFLSWRYFSGIHDYALYKMDKRDDYFVLRTIIKKKITFMVLVDFRCNVNTPDNFKLIFKAAKRITGKLRLSALITGSSLKSIDTILENNFFRAIGRNRPIISTKSFIEEKEGINNREFVLATLADSDGEVNW